MSIIGVGIDVVELERFERALRTSPALAVRIFTPAERLLSVPSMAARWAAKEALAKALGAPGDLHWHDAEIARTESGRPEIVVTGSVARRAAALNIARFHVSLSHDAGIASAVVIAED